MRTNLLLLLLGAALATGCNDMYDNHRLKPLEESKFYADRSSARSLLEGTVARGEARTEELLNTGRVGGKLADLLPMPVTRELLARGEDRFNTFCSPCHSRLGDGNGMIVQRGFPRPNSFHADSVRLKPAGHYFDVITNGFGRMYPYAPSIPVNDRWAIVAYVRALQLSRRIPYEELSGEEQKRLSGSRR